MDHANASRRSEGGGQKKRGGGCIVASLTILIQVLTIILLHLTTQHSLISLSHSYATHSLLTSDRAERGAPFHVTKLGRPTKPFTSWD